MTFTKLFSSITESTIWCEDDHTRIIWITLLAMANKNGFVFASPPGLANRARVPLESVLKALSKFLEPDPFSRTKDFEGRRIEEVDGGWKLINYAKHRAIRDEEERKDYMKKYMREYRKQDQLTDVNNVNSGKPELAQAEAEADIYISSNGNYESPRLPATQAKESYSNKTENDIVEAAFEHYCVSTERNRLTYRLTPSRKKIGLARLRDCLKLTGGDHDKAAGLMREAIDKLAESNWHMGRDPKTNGKKYCDWTANLFKSYERMEAWWNT